MDSVHEELEPVRPSPKHVMIRDYVRALARELGPGALAPSERDLLARFGVSRMTVRHAIAALVAEGVLERQPGRGTVVAAPPRGHTGVHGFTEELARRGQVAESRTLAVGSVAASARTAQLLEVRPGTAVLRWRRLRLTEGHPFCVSTTLLRTDQLSGLLEGDLVLSLYAELERRGRRPTWAEDTVNAAVAEVEDAALLGIDAGAPVMVQMRRAHWRQAPIEVTRSVIRAGMALRFQFQG